LKVEHSTAVVRSIWNPNVVLFWCEEQAYNSCCS
jgi:hypothetical protein